jgi:DNA-binding LytR/AlgR family response regulator
MVVFVTAHAEHALRAFEVDAADYITKPVRRERLQAALLRVAQRLAPAALAEQPMAPVLVVSDRGRVLRVRVAQPAATPLIDRWMPRCSRSSRRAFACGGGSGASVRPAGGSAGRGRGSGAR